MVKNPAIKPERRSFAEKMGNCAVGVKIIFGGSK